MSRENPPPDADPTLDPNLDVDGPALPSRSQIKREAAAVGDMALKLTKLNRAALVALPLSDEVRDAIFACQQMQKNARARQLRLVSKLLRETDTTLIVEALGNPSGKTRSMDDQEHAFLAERTRLLEGGDAALAEFLQRYPHADRQHLRQLIRQARRVPADDRSRRAGRDVLRAIRELQQRSVPEDLADLPSST